MNEKDAREIYNTARPSHHPQDGARLMYAKGYLEAIEKAKVLEDELDDIEPKCFCNCYRQITKALAKWEKEK